MIRQDLQTYLLSVDDFADAITFDSVPHLFLSRVPQTDEPLANFPAVIYRRMTGGHAHDLDGSAGMASALFEFHVVGIDSVAVETIGEALRLALQGFQGTMGATEVRCVTLDDETDDYIESKLGDDVGFFRTVYRYTIQHREAIPTFI